jgi:hypothetical protein
MNRHQKQTKTFEFSDFDWNFDNVPNDELIACCYWEYAAEGRWHSLNEEFQKVRRDNPETSEVDLIAQEKPFPGIQPSLYWERGSEVTVLTINWADFTNEEIIQYFRKWVKKNRPEQSHNPD